MTFETPEQFCEQIRTIVPEAIDKYTKGQCLDFFWILKRFFPQAEAYYDCDHVITLIDGRYYDITGEVDCENHLLMREHYYERLINGLNVFQTEVVSD